MGSERNSSPQRNKNCHKYLGSIENHTNKSTHDSIQSLHGNSTSPDAKLDQDQIKILGGTEKITAKNNKEFKHGNLSDQSTVPGGASELLQKNSSVQNLDAEREPNEIPNKKRQSKSWEFGDRYVKRGRPGPDFGPPIVTNHDPKPTKYLTGGPTPLNRLKNDDWERQSYKNLRFGTYKTIEGRTMSNDVKNKRCQLESSYSNRTITEQDKGLKRPDTLTTDQLDLLKTGISRNKSLNHPVLELWKVDKLVRFKKRSRYKLGKNSSDERILDTSKTKKHILGSALEKKHNLDSNYNNYDHNEDDIEKVDSMNRASSPLAKSNKKADYSDMSPNMSASHSRFFNAGKKSTSCCLDSTENFKFADHESSSSCVSVTSQKSAISTKQGIDKIRLKLDIENSELLLNRDESLDEISEAHYDSDLKKKNTHSMKFNITRCHKLNPREDPDQTAIEQSSHDDFRETSKDCLSPTTVKQTKRHKTRVNSVESFSVVQVFCSSKLWLLQSCEKQSKRSKMWTLYLDQKEKSLDIYDERNEPVPGLNLGRVNSILGSTTHGKMLITKPITAQSVVGTHRICLELGSPEESFRFIKRLKKFDPNVELNFKEHHHFDKVFEHTLDLSRSAATRPKFNKLKSNSCSPTAKTEYFNSIEFKFNQGSCNVQTELKTAAQTCLTAGSRGIAKSMTTRSQQTPNNERNKSSSNFSNISSSQISNRDDETKDSLSLESSRTESSNVRSATNDILRSPTSEPERWTRSNPSWINQWHSSIVFPAVGKNKATVDRADIDRLDEGEFINDNLMMFYLRWLQQKMENECPQIANRVYFHNTFFYERLTNVGKGKTGINYENVERWTSKVNIFEYDYIVVPVNESYHWYVAIICNAPKLLDKVENPFDKSKSSKEFQNIESNIQEHTGPNSVSQQSSPDLSREHSTGLEIKEKLETKSLGNQNEDLDDFESDPVLLHESDAEVYSAVGSAKRLKKNSQCTNIVSRKNCASEPRIITLDSFGRSHSLTCTNLKKYLLKEIESKLKIVVSDPGHLGKTAKNIPQQDNFFDCGLFVLGYIEIFLKNPDTFIFDLLHNRFPVEIKWQKPSEMRANIRTLLFKLQSENLESAQRLKKEKSKKDSNVKTSNSSVTTSLSSHHQLKCTENTSTSLVLNPSHLHRCKTTREEIDVKDEIEMKNNVVLRLNEKESPENKSLNNRVHLKENLSSVDSEKAGYYTENAELLTKIFNMNKPNIDKQNKLITSESSPTEITPSAQIRKAGLKSVERRYSQNNYETHSLPDRRHSILPHQHNGCDCSSPKMCCRSSDINLREENMMINEENSLSYHNTIAKVENHDQPQEDHSKDDFQSSLNSLHPDLSPNRSKKPPCSLLDDCAVTHTTSKISKFPPPLSPRSQPTKDDLSLENLEIIRGKHRRETKECCHRKRCKLSSSSWKRDGVEEAMLKSTSRSSTRITKDHTSKPLCKDSSVIFIE
ncbi:putative ulp1 protease family protein [Golovinomyces cichoracearum]|uniref:Putative ulp1 protease family protein n=1 Tax=Golovinomyces cichoracearum TaxID=62708 RepID=A0A420IJH9_9PEZI|nr:putative ulp1 protease family protein [Golovinomyces cichoracearum]